MIINNSTTELSTHGTIVSFNLRYTNAQTNISL